MRSWLSIYSLERPSDFNLRYAGAIDVGPLSLLQVVYSQSFSGDPVGVGCCVVPDARAGLHCLENNLGVFGRWVVDCTFS